MWLSYVFLFSLPAFSQSVGMPGVTWNGGFSEKDVCVRKDVWFGPRCASYFQQAKDGVSAFSEKGMFANFCPTTHRAISGQGAAIDGKIQACTDAGKRANELIDNHANGEKAFAEAKTLAGTMAKALHVCEQDLQKNVDELDNIQERIDERVEAVKNQALQQTERLKATDGHCNLEDVTGVFHTMADIFTRYQKGLGALREATADKAETAQGNYLETAKTLEGFARTGTINATGMETLKARIPQK